MTSSEVGKAVRTFGEGGDLSPYRPQPICSHGDSTVAVAGQERKGQIIFWDPQTGKQQAKLQGPDTWVNALALSPDGATLATISEDDFVRLWDVPRAARKHAAPPAQPASK